MCPGLATIDEESDISHLQHRNIFEYFERTWERFPNKTKTCATYLLVIRFDFQPGFD